MTDLAKLTHFMAPYYQDSGDVALLTEYLSDYTYPECAASALWFELGGSKGLQMDGVQKIDTGAEKFVYSEPGTMQLACFKQAEYFEDRCSMLGGGVGSLSIRVRQSAVGGITEEFGGDAPDTDGVISE